MKRRNRKIVYWSAADVRTLNRLAGRRSARDIGKQLSRSEIAVRLKASQLQISLRVD